MAAKRTGDLMSRATNEYGSCTVTIGVSALASAKVCARAAYQAGTSDRPA